MKIALTIILTLFSAQIFSQNCNCKEKPELKNIISCQKTVFKNGATVYWSFDCNSSWLTYQNKKRIRKIFDLDKNSMELTGRLGFINWTEFKSSFLIENKVISGCCDPSKYILFDKNNGIEIQNLGTSLFITDLKESYPFIVTLKDWNTILFTNLTTNKIYKISLPKGRLEKSLLNSNYLFADYLFEKGSLNDDVFIISYKYKENKNVNWKIGVVKINTKIR